MATFNQINDWLENMVESANCGTDVFTIALSNITPGSETTPPTGDGDGILANVTQIAYTNLSTRVITTNTSAQVAGTYELNLTDLVLTSTGGTTGPFRYVYVYDETTTAPADALVCFYDYGSSITLQDTETLTVDFDDANGLFQIS